MSRVLVVDDSEMIAHLLMNLLTENGHEVTEVSEHAERLLEPDSELWDGIDAMVCDLQMPGVTGLEVLAVAAVYHPTITRIVLTGYDQDAAALEVLADLADHVLLKPRDVLDIVTIIAALQ